MTSTPLASFLSHLLAALWDTNLYYCSQLELRVIPAIVVGAGRKRTLEGLSSRKSEIDKSEVLCGGSRWRKASGPNFNVLASGD